MEFTKLENSILNWIVAKKSKPAITLQIESAQFTKRIWTKNNCCTRFNVDRSLSKVTVALPINGPTIQSNCKRFGATTLLWAENGFLNQIEILLTLNGENFPQDLEDFQMIDP